MRLFNDSINDIIHAIRLAIEFTEDIGFAEFSIDEKTQFAVIRCFEIRGKATKRLPDNFREERKEIPWKAMAGMRDRLIHAYDQIDVELVWNTVLNTLPSLLIAMEEIVDNK